MSLNIKYLASQGIPFEPLPEHRLPMVVLVGYSNVGKSSLINALAGTKVAYTAKRAGKTRTVNTYSVAGTSCLVDLPGFGYATGDAIEVAEFQDLVRIFWTETAGNKLVVHLLDSRRGLRPLDVVASEYFSSSSYLRLMGKWDKLSASERQQRKALGIPWSVGDKECVAVVRQKVSEFLRTCDFH